MCESRWTPDLGIALTNVATMRGFMQSETCYHALHLHFLRDDLTAGLVCVGLIHGRACHSHETIHLASLRSRGVARRIFAGLDSQSITNRQVP